MSNNVETFSELDNMPTDYLRTLLSLDIDEASGVELDAETIIHILEVIQARETADGSGEKVDVAAAWEKFNNKYRPLDTALEKDEPKCEAAKTKRHIRLKRFTVTVAVVIAVFACGTIAAGAAGLDLWGAVVEWAGETFGLDNNIKYVDLVENKVVNPCSDLQDALSTDGIDAKLVPTWLPDGFEQGKLDHNITPQMSVYQASYKNGEKEITIQIFSYYGGTEATHTYEKLPDGSTQYKVCDVTHSIAVNSDGSVVALWSNGNCECSILADVTEAEMKQIIDSIYRG